MSLKAKAAPKARRRHICKHDACFESASVKGFCRLHFLKVLAGKAQGNLKPQGKLRIVASRNED